MTLIEGAEETFVERKQQEKGRFVLWQDKGVGKTELIEAKENRSKV